MNKKKSLRKAKLTEELINYYKDKIADLIAINMKAQLTHDTKIKIVWDTKEKKITITRSQAADALRQYETIDGTYEDKLIAYYVALGFDVEIPTEENE